MMLPIFPHDWYPAQTKKNKINFKKYFGGFFFFITHVKASRDELQSVLLSSCKKTNIRTL